MIRDKIKKLCKDRDLTIRELERRAGLKPGCIKKWCGHASPKLSNAIAVAKVLGVSVDFLFSDEE